MNLYIIDERLFVAEDSYFCAQRPRPLLRGAAPAAQGRKADITSSGVGNLRVRNQVIRQIAAQTPQAKCDRAFALASKKYEAGYRSAGH